MAIMHDERSTTETLPRDPILGDEEIVEGVIVENPTALLEIPFTLEELRIIAPAARAADLPTHEYIRRVTLAQAQRDQD